MRSKTVALGLGSNLQAPIENLRNALSEIKKNALFEVIAVSPIYESDALLPEKASAEWNKKFLNAAVLCRISDEVRPDDLLREIKSIENKMGRSQSERWAPRLIDIDILYWDQENYYSEKINIPHRSLFERPFALLPLLDIWPDVNFELPDWAHKWREEKPYNTQKSQKYFWPKMVGILNITKDSFSDGGRFLDADNLHCHFNEFIEQGADIIDIGAESTRPGAIAVSEKEEYKNLNWALNEIKSKVPVSLDCRNANVVSRILESYQISYLNDVTGFVEPEMKKLFLKSKLPAFVMHSLSVPPQADLILDLSINPCHQLTDWWRQRSQDLIEIGISPEKLIFDPGIGFGKTKHQNMYILRHLNELSGIKNPIMIGHSRKSFLSLLSDRPAEQRDLETALITKELNLAYVQYLRVHNIKTQVMALK